MAIILLIEVLTLRWYTNRDGQNVMDVGGTQAHGARTSKSKVSQYEEWCRFEKAGTSHAYVSQHG